MYNTGENLQHLWTEMDRPDRVGTCTKLRQGQLLMQRYKYAHEYANNIARYDYLAEPIKTKSIELARRMVEHATNCAKCAGEEVLLEPLFYGVYK